MIQDRVPRVGLVVVTIGRDEALGALLRSVAASDTPPAAVVVVNQSGRPLRLAPLGGVPLQVVDSAGGLSAGRNVGVQALTADMDYVLFPNDHSRLEPGTLRAVVREVQRHGWPEVLAGALCESGGPRFVLPPDGVALDRRTVWKAIEPATVFAVGAVRECGFDQGLGSGSPGPWQSGEGTDLLLRLAAGGARLVSCPLVRMHGAGERRDLSDEEYLVKVRAYARGTGRVFAVHRYSPRDRARLLLGPWVRLLVRRRWRLWEVRAAAARSVGRWEGLRGRVVRELTYRAR